MICTSIQHKTLDEILEILDDPFVEIAEIRLDRCSLDDEDIETLFGSTDKPLVATCRAAECVDFQHRLTVATEAGARFVDLELDAPAPVSKYFRKLCQDNGAGLIRSCHDFSGTPDLQMLKMLTARAFRYGADIAKIVTTCRCAADAVTIASLYAQTGDDGTPVCRSRLIAFGMGEEGRTTRLGCLKEGAPFTYAALSEGEETAPGQWTLADMHDAVYGSRTGFFRNSLVMPASKSFAQRAIIAAALAEGTSRLRGYTACDDSEAAIGLARALGAKVRHGKVLTIEGAGHAVSAPGKANAGESGLLTRLMIPLLACIGDGDAAIEGEKTLLRRPLSGAGDIMAAFGVVLSNEAAQANARELHVPLRIKGKLIPGTADISGKDGSQLISGLLMALPLCEKPSQVFVSEPKSIPYMFITIDVLRRFGIRIGSEMEGDAQMLEQQDWSSCTGISFKMKGGQKYRAADFSLEGDWSAAAPFLVAGAIFGCAELEGLDTSSLQADISVMDILVDAGAIVSQEEDSGLICARKAPLEAFCCDLGNAPDLFPIVSVLAAFCPGESRISGIGRLTGKESNRGEAILSMLDGMDVPARLEGDDLVVSGETLTSRIMGGRLLKGGHFSARGDHRIAMALAVASLGTESPVIIDDEACVGKSFPGFFDLFRH